MTSSARMARQEADVARRNRDIVLGDKQYDFVYDDDNKYPAFIGGIGSGKTFAGAVKALRKAVDYPGSLGVIGAPNYPQLRDSTIRMVFDVFPPAIRAEYLRSDKLLRLVNGSEILFKSMDEPDNQRGPNLSWFWLDEGPLCGYYAWQVMKGRLRQVANGAQGWITGSPHGQDQFWEDFENTPKPGHKLYRASTRENQPNLPDNYVEDLGYEGQFALQEIEGLFVRFEGLVYSFLAEWHLGEWPTMHGDGYVRKPRRRIGGVDWGFTNPAVALPIYIDHDQRVYVLDEFYRRQAGYAGVENAVVEFTRQYGIEVWYCGPDEPEHILELNARLRREGLRSSAVEADDEINPGLDTVRRVMTLRGDGRAGFQLSARCAQTKAELNSYSYPGAQSGAARDPQEKPIKKLDHAMDALRYALHTELGPLTRPGTMPRDMVSNGVQPGVFSHTIVRRDAGAFAGMVAGGRDGGGTNGTSGRRL